MKSEILDENENNDCNLEDKIACDKKVTKDLKHCEKSTSRSMPEESASGSDTKNKKNHLFEVPTSTSKQKVAKNRKKSDCNVQHVLRALNSLTTPEEKLAAMCQKYADLFDENRKLQGSVKQLEKQVTNMTKEKDQVRAELSKSVLSRSRLENLCRELQRQNKEIKDESVQKIREEEEKRKEVSAKFQTTLNEITELMKEDNDKTMKLRDDNIDMTSKLKSIYEQYGIREQQLEKMAKQMALEAQLYEARLAKMEMETSAEKEILLREKQQLLVTLTEYQAKFQEYQNIEVTLRNQVALYNSKYEEFEKSLTRSNKMFTGFKEEMENMSYKIVKLESETLAWKQRWEKTQSALVEMAAEKHKSDQEVILAAKQMATLHKLCRTLQVERAQLLSKLNTNKFVTTSDDPFTENQLNGNSENCSNDDAKDNAISLNSKKTESAEQYKKSKSVQKKTKQTTATQENEYPSVENSCELVASVAVDSQPLSDTTDLNLYLETSASTERSITETSASSNEPVNGQVNGNLSPSETEESADLQTKQSPSQKNSESDDLISTRNSKANKNSPKKKNKKQ